MEKVTSQDFNAIDKVDNEYAAEERQRLMEQNQVSCSRYVHADRRQIFFYDYHFLGEYSIRMVKNTIC